jgi:hypothetical protein
MIGLLRNLILLSLIISNHIYHSPISSSWNENIKAKNIHLFPFFYNFILSHFSLNLSINKSSFWYKLFILKEKSFYRESIFFKSFNDICNFKFTEYRFTSLSLYQIGDFYIQFIHCFLILWMKSLLLHQNIISFLIWHD